VTTPALAPQEPASQELTPEAVLMRKFLSWALVYLAGMGLLVAGLWLLFRNVISMVMLGVIVVVMLPAIGSARRLASQNRVDPALLLVSSLIWALALVPAVRGATGALLSLVPVVLAVAYSSRRTLRQIIAGSVVVCGVAALLATFEDLLPTQLDVTAAGRIEGAAATTLVALLSFSLWHSATRLWAMLARATEANRALAESERTLERKVEERTAELSDLNEFARLVNATLDLDRVLSTMNAGLRSSSVSIRWGSSS
jgi:hypothetical protein